MAAIENTQGVMVSSIGFKQMVKGTEDVKYKGSIDGVPDSADELIKMLTADPELALRIRLDLLTVADQLAKRACKKAEDDGEIVPNEFDFTTLFMASGGPKKTAKFMCDKLEGEIAELALLARANRKAGDMEGMDEAFDKMEVLEEKLEEWEAKRETERKAKAASRAANKDS